MALLKDRTLPSGSTILVTGANGLIGSHTVDQCLAQGYKVRGAVRDPIKNQWMQEHSDAKYGPGRFEFIQVRDFAGPYDDAVEGVSGVAHISLVYPNSPDPNDTIPQNINGTLSALRAAAREPSVKRFVFSSSALAVQRVDPDASGIVTADMWNEDVVKKAWTQPFDPENIVNVYCAIKVQTEQAMWRFMRDEKPHFAANSIVVPFILGRRISHEHQGHISSTGLVLAYFHGQQKEMKRFNNAHYPLYHCDTADIGRIHMLALVHSNLENERVFPWATEYNGNDVLAAFRKMFPKKEFAEDAPGLHRCSVWSIEGRAKAEACLRDLGRPGFVSFDESMRGVAEGLE